MKLKKYLETNNITSETFARKVGVSIYTVQKWRRMPHRKPRQHVKKIQQVTKGAVGPKDWYA